MLSDVGLGETGERRHGGPGKKDGAAAAEPGWPYEFHLAYSLGCRAAGVQRVRRRSGAGFLRRLWTPVGLFSNGGGLLYYFVGLPDSRRQVAAGSGGGQAPFRTDKLIFFHGGCAAYQLRRCGEGGACDAVFPGSSRYAAAGKAGAANLRGRESVPAVTAGSGGGAADRRAGKASAGGD